MLDMFFMAEPVIECPVLSTYIHESSLPMGRKNYEKMYDWNSIFNGYVQNLSGPLTAQVDEAIIQNYSLRPHSCTITRAWVKCHTTYSLRGVAKYWATWHDVSFICICNINTGCDILNGTCSRSNPKKYAVTGRVITHLCNDFMSVKGVLVFMLG